MFGLECEVWQVRASYDQKPYRRLLMETYGATVHPSPSDLTSSGRAVLAARPGLTGSLGIAISEAVEVGRRATRPPATRSGSVLNHVLLHQTVIGEEAIKQMAHGRRHARRDRRLHRRRIQLRRAGRSRSCGRSWPAG